MSQQAWRYDTFELRPSVKTAEGYLICDATIAAPGVLPYLNADGTIRRELVLPETLNNLETLGSLAFKPITDEHPREDGKPVMVTAKNEDAYGVGTVLDPVEYVPTEEGYLHGRVKVRMLIRRDSAIRKIEREDGFRGTSPGYLVETDETPGVHPIFGRYDAIQTRRSGNHVALTRLPRGGMDAASFRVDSLPAGGAVMLRFDDAYTPGITREMNHAVRMLRALGFNEEDLIRQLANESDMSEDAVRKMLLGEDDWEETAIQKFAGLLGIRTDAGDPKHYTSGTGAKPMPQINIDGVTLSIEDVATAQAINDALQRRDSKIADLTTKAEAAAETKTRADALEAEKTALIEERDTLKGRCDTLQQQVDTRTDGVNEEAMRSYFNERNEIIGVAQGLKVDGIDALDNAALKRACVEAYRKDAADLKDASDQVIHGSYLVVKDAVSSRRDSVNAVGGFAQQRRHGQRQREDAFAPYTDNRMNAWKNQSTH